MKKKELHCSMRALLMWQRGKCGLRIRHFGTGVRVSLVVNGGTVDAECTYVVGSNCAFEANLQSV